MNFGALFPDINEGAISALLSKTAFALWFAKGQRQLFDGDRDRRADEQIGSARQR